MRWGGRPHFTAYLVGVSGPVEHFVVLLLLSPAWGGEVRAGLAVLGLGRAARGRARADNHNGKGGVGRGHRRGFVVHVLLSPFGPMALFVCMRQSLVLHVS